ncbi:DNA-binding transcriptional LysR family regulator [Salirhabdus euzebyi]|uniref:DNA-binding transcriptional LysR family regulator n=1 Tax=Salirhabdus euzebyi TaxID=394506 RepID=A0A841Q595_9BACI|nr:LysR family transcriptional regulator [Salirhabdus euzebyi]MBB6453537.1 DNA-binding transcriptional LysR family regulator [Salirhabdus euzebyi]
MIELFQTFIKVVESGSLSEAARILHTNQPNITVRIQKLEHHLGVSLFDREGKKLILNEIGKKTFNQAKSLYLAYDDLIQDIRQHNNPNHGHIRIGGGFPVLNSILPPFLHDFHKEFPNVTYGLQIGTSEEIYKLVEQYEIDFGFITTTKEREMIEHIDLGLGTKIFLVVPEGHPYTKSTNISKELLTELPFITFKQSSNYMNFLIDYLGQHGVEIKSTVEADHLEIMVKMVEEGMGASFLPLTENKEYVRNRKVTCMDIDQIDFPIKYIQLIYRKNRFMSPSFEQFISSVTRYSAR